MRFMALATDYDGTLARRGVVARQTVRALQALRESGRRLILITGRQLDDVAGVFARADLFDRIVAENGGVLYRRETREQVLLTDPVDPRLVRALREARVEPLSVGRTVIATSEARQDEVRDAIRELGLELDLAFNKGAVMVLPSGVTKGSGLEAALAELHLSRAVVVGIGDAENDRPFLSVCGRGVATANALAAVKDGADHVTRRENGAGVRELIADLLRDDLARPAGRS